MFFFAFFHISSHLCFDNYYVIFNLNTLPAGYQVTLPKAGVADSVDSDADPETGQTPPTHLLIEGEAALTLDMGVWTSVSDFEDLFFGAQPPWVSHFDSVFSSRCRRQVEQESVRLRHARPAARHISQTDAFNQESPQTRRHHQQTQCRRHQERSLRHRR